MAWPKGKPLSPETRAKLSATRRGRKLAPEHVAKIAAAKIRPDAGYAAIHLWLGKHFPKTGVCEECGADAKTQYAFLRHPEPHTRDRDDYRELMPEVSRRARQASRLSARS